MKPVMLPHLHREALPGGLQERTAVRPRIVGGVVPDEVRLERLAALRADRADLRARGSTATAPRASLRGPSPGPRSTSAPHQVDNPADHERPGDQRDAPRDRRPRNGRSSGARRSRSFRAKDPGPRRQRSTGRTRRPDPSRRGPGEPPMAPVGRASASTTRRSRPGSAPGRTARRRGPPPP